jgi:hypothetical protein
MMSSPTGQSYTVKMDRADAPMKGDPGIPTVSVKKVGKNALVDTDKRNARVVGVETMTMSGEGNAITVNYENKERRTSTPFKEMKQ